MLNGSQNLVSCFLLLWIFSVFQKNFRRKKNDPNYFLGVVYFVEKKKNRKQERKEGRKKANRQANKNCSFANTSH